MIKSLITLSIIIISTLVAAAPTILLNQNNLKSENIIQPYVVAQSRHFDAGTTSSLKGSNDDYTYPSVLYKFNIFDVGATNPSDYSKLELDIAGCGVQSDDTDAPVNGWSSVDSSSITFNWQDLMDDVIAKFKAYAYTHHNGDGIQEWLNYTINLSMSGNVEFFLTTRIWAYNRGNHLINKAGKGYGYYGIHEVRILI